jgi:hypothetical protein
MLAGLFNTACFVQAFLFGAPSVFVGRHWAQGQKHDLANSIQNFPECQTFFSLQRLETIL